MPIPLFHVFSDDRFMDLTLYQYGYEKCRPLHSFGPSVRNHFLFHYIFSGKGTLLVDETKTSTKEYKLHGGMGFLIEPERINTYFADREDPWEYAWVEFSGLKAKEILDTAGLSTESPVFIPTSHQISETLKSELLHLASSPSETSSLHLIGHLYLIMDALLTGSASRRRVQNGKRSQFYTDEAITFISQNYALPITIEDMAQRLNLDRSYFGKIFKEVIGQSPLGISDPLPYVQGCRASENIRRTSQRYQRSGRLPQSASLFQSLQKCLWAVTPGIPPEKQDYS